MLGRKNYLLLLNGKIVNKVSHFCKKKKKRQDQLHKDTALKRSFHEVTSCLDSSTSLREKERNGRDLSLISEPPSLLGRAGSLNRKPKSTPLLFHLKPRTKQWQSYNQRTCKIFCKGLTPPPPPLLLGRFSRV